MPCDVRPNQSFTRFWHHHLQSSIQLVPKNVVCWIFTSWVTGVVFRGVKREISPPLLSSSLHLKQPVRLTNIREFWPRELWASREDRLWTPKRKSCTLPCSVTESPCWICMLGRWRHLESITRESSDRPSIADVKLAFYELCGRNYP